MKNIYVITSSLSDIGKGWVAASLGSILMDSIIVKVDPVIKRLIDDGLCKDLSKISSDYANYRKLNNSLDYENIIRGGEVLYDFISSKSYLCSIYDYASSSRFNMSDVSDFFAKKLSEMRIMSYDNIILELGGSVYDEGNFYLTDGIRKFAYLNNYNLKIVLLSLLLPSDDKVDRIKTSVVKDGISKICEIYKKNPDLVLVRSHLLSNSDISDINNSIEKISTRVLISKDFFIHIPTFKSIHQLKKYIKANLRIN